MKVSTHFTADEYALLILTLTFRRLTRLIIIGSALVALSLVNLVYSVPGHGQPLFSPGYFISLGAMVMLLPLFTYMQAKKTYQSMERLHGTVGYEFTPEKFILSAPGFHGEKTWDKLFKILELKNWILIYESDTVANLIPKKELTTQEVNDIRAILKTAKTQKGITLRKD